MDAAGLIESYLLYPFMFRGTAGDCNTATMGVWHTNDSTKNLPVSSYKFGILIVIQTGNGILKIFANNNGAKKIYTSVLDVTAGWLDF